MAVEAHHLNPLFSSNRDMMNNPLETNGLLYNNQIRYGTVQATTTPFNPTVECQTPLLNPIYNNTIAPVDCFLHQQSMKPTIQSVDSSVTFTSDNNANFLRPVSSSSMRKRPREESVVVNPADPLMFLGQALSFNVQQQHFDIDQLISNHVERMRMEIEERRKLQGRRIMEAIEQGLMKTLRAKDEEINNIGKLNLFLEEKVKSLCVENQIWRDVAQSSEANVNALRSNLQQVLAAVERNRWEEPAVADDEQSCCGSNGEYDSEERCRLAGEAQDKNKVRRVTKAMCRSCGKGEASVLLLPCRHMCLCTVCGSSLNTCPICKSPKNASLNVNLSS